MVRVQSIMKIGLRLVRLAVILVLSALVWGKAMFLPHPYNTPDALLIGHDSSYGYPWEFGFDTCDVGVSFPFGITISKPGTFVLDGLIWAAVVGFGAAVLYGITRIANPNGCADGD